jgi:hypothetical protein
LGFGKGMIGFWISWRNKLKKKLKKLWGRLGEVWLEMIDVILFFWEFDYVYLLQIDLM